MGDHVARYGFQITSTADGPKVNHTLAKLTAEQIAAFDKIIVLGMNSKQNRYDIKSENLKILPMFNIDDHIWDLKTLARKTVDLELDGLHRLYELVRKDSARLKIELEVADASGNYPTNGYEKWEPIPASTVGNGDAFAEFQRVAIREMSDENRLKLTNALIDTSTRLAALPRSTREFLAMLYERRDPGESQRFKSDKCSAHIYYGVAKRLYRGDDFDGELEILIQSGCVDVDAEQPDYAGPADIGLIFTPSCYELKVSFTEYMELKNLTYRTVIGNADLSAF